MSALNGRVRISQCWVMTRHFSDRIGGMSGTVEQCVFITSAALADAAMNAARTHEFAMTARMEMCDLMDDREGFRIALRERLATRALIKQLRLSQSLRHPTV